MEDFETGFLLFGIASVRGTDVAAACDSWDVSEVKEYGRVSRLKTG